MNSLDSIISNGPQCEAPKQAESSSLISQLQRQKLQYQERLATVTAALDALEKNPEVAKLLELVARASY